MSFVGTFHTLSALRVLRHSFSRRHRSRRDRRGILLRPRGIIRARIMQSSWIRTITRTTFPRCDDQRQEPATRSRRARTFTSRAFQSTIGARSRTSHGCIHRRNRARDSSGRYDGTVRRTGQAGGRWESHKHRYGHPQESTQAGLKRVAQTSQRTQCSPSVVQQAWCKFKCVGRVRFRCLFS